MSLSSQALPSDLITIIAHLFDSARDLLSFSLICKRYHGLLFGRKDQNIIDRHIQKIIRISYSKDYVISHKFAVVDVFAYLPNSSIHGIQRQWRLDYYHHELGKITMADKIARRSMKYILYNPEKPAELCTGSIITAAKQKEAEKLCQKHGRLILEQDHRFGRIIGTSKHYYHTGVKPVIKTEITYNNEGEKHGNENHYDERGNMTTTFPYCKGKLHGITKTISANQSFQTSCFKDGELNGDQETYQMLFGQSPVLVHRERFVGNQLEGPEEHWASSGILQQLCYYHRDKKHGEERHWDPITGIMIGIGQWVDDRRTGEQVNFDRVDGRRIAHYLFEGDEMRVLFSENNAKAQEEDDIDFVLFGGGVITG